MKTITKEINLLDIEDIEEVLSANLGAKISIYDVDCTLVYCVPADADVPNGMYLEFAIGNDEASSFDLFWNEEMERHIWKGKQLSLDEPALPIEEIFNFDISAFKSFDSWTDTSD